MILYLIKNEVPLFFFLNFASILLVFSIIGIIWNFRNLILLLIFIELMFLSINLQFIFLVNYTNFYLGYLYALLNIVIAAVESVIGLSILILFYRITNSIDYNSLSSLKY